MGPWRKVCSRVLTRQTFFRQLSRLLCPLAWVYYKKRYLAYAEPLGDIELDPLDIAGWYRGDIYSQIAFLGQIKRGDWSPRLTEREAYMAYNPKYESVKQRYVQGMRWRDTDVFRQFSTHLPTKPLPRGARDLDELERFYEQRYDRLYEALKEQGFQPAGDGVRPVYVCIDRDGKMYYTVDGNHRLAMVLVLGVRKIPVKVLRRHKLWQLRRDELCRKMRRGDLSEQDCRILVHPDLQDLRAKCAPMEDGGVLPQENAD